MLPGRHSLLLSLELWPVGPLDFLPQGRLLERLPERLPWLPSLVVLLPVSLLLALGLVQAPQISPQSSNSSQPLPPPPPRPGPEAASA
jgi:hypothetical protein